MSNVTVFDRTMQVAMSALEALDTPRALSVYMLARAYLVDEYEPVTFSYELKSLVFDPSQYGHDDIDLLRLDYQATVMLTKLPPKDENSTILHECAIQAFKESEARNAFRNGLWVNPSQVLSRFAYHGYECELDEFKRQLRRILGRCPSLPRLSELGSWTSGASVDLSRQWSSQALKAEMGLTVTYPLAKALTAIGDSLSPLINANDAWILVPGNIIDTVPKNITTNRTIGKEPSINSFFQRATGDVLRHRLLREGIDLNDQTLNQRACMMAYLSGYATIDMRDASNSTLSFMVRECFPSDWSDTFELLRSPYGTFNDRRAVFAREADWFEYQMLSSMGNGFTFELESVIFYSACLACGVPDYDIYIYGDDIIVPQCYVDRVTAFLALLGFDTNLEKSFVSGAFFESCGAYSFYGVDITPFKIKDLLNGNKDCIVLANKIRWFSHTVNNGISCDRRFLPAWRLCLSGLSDAVRRQCRGPINSGLTLWTNLSETSAKYSKKRGAVSTYQLVPREGATLSADWPSLLQHRLWEQTRSSGECRFYGNTLKVEFFESHRMAPLFIEKGWYDFGPWETWAR